MTVCNLHLINVLGITIEQNDPFAYRIPDEFAVGVLPTGQPQSPDRVIVGPGREARKQEKVLQDGNLERFLMKRLTGGEISRPYSALFDGEL